MRKLLLINDGDANRTVMLRTLPADVQLTVASVQVVLAQIAWRATAQALALKLGNVPVKSTAVDPA
jgi:hypothetical protein